MSQEDVELICHATLVVSLFVYLGCVGWMGRTP
jgi:hypothetical protein